MFDDRLSCLCDKTATQKVPLIARFMGPTWGLSRSDKTQVGPILVAWTLPSGTSYISGQ